MDPDPDPDLPGSAFIWLLWIRIRIGNANPDPGAWKLAKIYKKKCFLPFNVKKNSTFCESQFWSGSGSAWIRIGLASWIRIRIRISIEVKSWIPIRNGFRSTTLLANNMRKTQRYILTELRLRYLTKHPRMKLEKYPYISLDFFFSRLIWKHWMNRIRCLA